MTEWSEYERLILYRMDRLEEAVRLTRRDIAGLKKRSAAWGAAAGAIPGLAALLAKIFG